MEDFIPMIVSTLHNVQQQIQKYCETNIQLLNKLTSSFNSKFTKLETSNPRAFQSQWELL
jgi:hypothetical protein